MTLPKKTRRLWYGLLVALVALVSSAPTLGNIFAHDDVPILIEDSRVTSPASWDEYLTEAYWPAPLRRDLYRPITSLTLGVEWQMGGGNPVSYKIMQVALGMAAAIAMLALALRLLPPIGALGVGLLFAAHPVHVEAIATAVNQAEVLVGILAALAVAWYIDRRRRGELSIRDHAGLAGITLIAAHVKEGGIMIPALLFAVEVFLISGPVWRERWRKVSSLVVWQTFAVTVAVGIRSMIPTENASGTFVAESFVDRGIGSRFMTMLDVVPEWFRLLLWPSKLSAEYSPDRIVPAVGWGSDQTIGMLIIILIVVLAWRLRKTVPVFSFGVAWTAVALFPVSNVLVPTGIQLAERTLFLPSFGVLLAVGAVAFALPSALPQARRALPALGAVMLTLVLAMAMSRSISRHRVWHDNYRLWGQTLIDSPTSYRAWTAFATLMNKLGERDRAIYGMTIAIGIWDKTSGPIWQLARWHHDAGNCEAAIPLYQRSVDLTEYAPARSGLVHCLVQVGAFPEARAAALEGIREGVLVTAFRTWARTIDRAIKENAPVGSVVYDPSLVAIKNDTIAGGPELTP